MGGSCHKVTAKGPFMGDDLVSCADKKPAEEADAGLSWAGIEPPLPPEKCPPATAACKGGKGSLMKFFAWGAACCDPKHIGFSDNIPMFKMQITNMPKYQNSGTNGRFKANRGAGSICGMVKSLAAGVSAGDDGWGM